MKELKRLSKKGFWVLCLLCIFNCQVWAQTEEVIDDDDTLVADTLFTDTLAVDSIRLPWPESVQRQLDHLLQHSMFDTSQLGLMVWDLTADSCIYKHNERQLLRPASTMKVITAIAAIDRLGGSFQFKTQLKYTGTIDNHCLNGDLYCVGGMDPRFNNDDMKTMVSSLREMGIDTIRGHIYADVSLKDSNKFGEGWCWDDDNPVLTPLLLGRKDQFMDRFMSKIHEDSIVCSYYTYSNKTCPSEAYTISTRSHSIDQILMRMLKESDNLYAECLFYQMAASTGNRPASAKSARWVEKKLVQKVGLDPSRYKFADGSGLSLYNYVSAELEIRLLRYAFNNNNIYLHLHPALPIAGVDGTLKKRMHGSFTHGNVYAKTGTVTGISSLAGYCKAANGHDLCFAIINQGVMHGKNGRNFQDKVCTLLCQPQ